MPNPAADAPQAGSPPQAGAQNQPTPKPTGQPAETPLSLDSEITVLVAENLPQRMKVQDLVAAYSKRQDAEALMSAARKSMVKNEAIEALANRWASMPPELQREMLKDLEDPSRIKSRVASRQRPQVQDDDDDDPFSLPQQRQQNGHAQPSGEFEALKSEIAQLRSVVAAREQREQTMSMREQIASHMASFPDVYGTMPEKARERAIGQLMLAASGGGGSVEQLVTDQAFYLASFRGGATASQPGGGTSPAPGAGGATSPFSPPRKFDKASMEDGSFMAALKAAAGV